jgi:hypothetical protein
MKIGMLPAPRNGGFQDPDYWIWCGSAIRGEDSRYHLLASRWPRKYPFYWGYCFYSEIVRAVSDRPEGPFEFAEVVFADRGAGFWDGRMTHNPTIHRVGDTYLLFYIGTTFEGEKPSVDMLENYEPGRIPSTPHAIRPFGVWSVASGKWSHSRPAGGFMGSLGRDQPSALHFAGWAGFSVLPLLRGPDRIGGGR